MMCLCANPICRKAVDTIYDHSKIGDRIFCSADCSIQWVEANRRLTNAAHPTWIHRERPKIAPAEPASDPHADIEQPDG